MSFSNDFDAWVRDSYGGRIDRLAVQFGVTTKTLQYWRSGQRSPDVKHLWGLRETEDRRLRQIVRAELERQMPGIFTKEKS